MEEILVKKIPVKEILVKKKNFFSTHINITKSYLTIEEIIVEHVKSNNLVFRDHK